jgi:hypothetical protein
MHLTVAKLLPYVSIAAGVLILIYPRLLSFVIAAYLIVTGLIGLNDIYHFARKSRRGASRPGRDRIIGRVRATFLQILRRRSRSGNVPRAGA